MFLKRWKGNNSVSLCSFSLFLSLSLYLCLSVCLSLYFCLSVSLSLSGSFSLSLVVSLSLSISVSLSEITNLDWSGLSSMICTSFLPTQLFWTGTFHSSVFKVSFRYCCNYLLVFSFSLPTPPSCLPTLNLVLFCLFLSEIYTGHRSFSSKTEQLFCQLG